MNDVRKIMESSSPSNHLCYSKSF